MRMLGDNLKRDSFKISTDRVLYGSEESVGQRACLCAVSCYDCMAQ